LSAGGAGAPASFDPGSWRAHGGGHRARLADDSVSLRICKDAPAVEEVSGPAFLFRGVESNPRNEINMEGITCRAVPAFAALRDTRPALHGTRGDLRGEDLFHGLHFLDVGAVPRIETLF